MTQTPNELTPGDPANPRLSPLPIVAGVVAAALGPAVWAGFYSAVGAAWIPPLLIGVGVGLAMRYTSPYPDARIPVLAAILAALSGIGGYLVTDLAVITWLGPDGQPVQPSIADAARRFVNDIFMVLLVAIGAYIAYVLAKRI